MRKIQILNISAVTTVGLPISTVGKVTGVCNTMQFLNKSIKTSHVEKYCLWKSDQPTAVNYPGYEL